MIHTSLKTLESGGDLAPGSRFGKAFACLRDLRAATGHVAGKIEVVPGEVWASVMIKEGRAPEQAVLEYHERYADIHLCLAGGERIGWIPGLGGTTAAGAFNANDDYGLLTDSFTDSVSISGDQLVIFFPGEPHAPLIGDGIITKVCVKVLIKD
ncbi:MAG TPA: YhcH/YjgK/YiaL family protein [Rariglobus sp.]